MTKITPYTDLIIPPHPGTNVHSFSQDGSNTKIMKAPGFEQYWHDQIMWDRALDFYLQQNAFFKTRLAHILETSLDDGLLLKAEHFQTSFLQIDAEINKMNGDIDMFRRSLENTWKDKERITYRYRALNDEVNEFENKYAALRNEFHQFVVAAKKIS